MIHRFSIQQEVELEEVCAEDYSECYLLIYPTSDKADPPSPSRLRITPPHPK